MAGSPSRAAPLAGGDATPQPNFSISAASSAMRMPCARHAYGSGRKLMACQQVPWPELLREPGRRGSLEGQVRHRRASVGVTGRSRNLVIEEEFMGVSVRESQD